MGVEKQSAECSTNEYVFLLSKETNLNNLYKEIRFVSVEAG